MRKVALWKVENSCAALGRSLFACELLVYRSLMRCGGVGLSWLISLSVVSGRLSRLKERWSLSRRVVEALCHE